MMVVSCLNQVIFVILIGFGFTSSKMIGRYQGKLPSYSHSFQFFVTDKGRNNLSLNLLTTCD